MFSSSCRCKVLSWKFLSIIMSFDRVMSSVPQCLLSFPESSAPAPALCLCLALTPHKPVFNRLWIVLHGARELLKPSKLLPQPGKPGHQMTDFNYGIYCTFITFINHICKKRLVVDTALLTCVLYWHVCSTDTCALLTRVLYWHVCSTETLCSWNVVL